jgi:hypothetical protein
MVSFFIFISYDSILPPSRWEEPCHLLVTLHLVLQNPKELLLAVSNLLFSCAPFMLKIKRIILTCFNSSNNKEIKQQFKLVD